MVRVIIKRPDGEIGVIELHIPSINVLYVIDERIDGKVSDIYNDYPNGGIVIRFKNRTYI